MGCSVVLAGCEDVTDEGLLHLSHLSRLASLNLSNCCKVQPLTASCELTRQVA